MSDDTARTTDFPTPEHESLARRRKRTLIARAAKGLKHRLATYRAVTIVAVFALVALGAYTVTDDRPTDGDAQQTILLGTGKAGVDAPRSATSNATSEASGEHVGDGQASFYGEELAGNPTASGETFDPAKLTAAHRTLPLGSRVRVTNLRNGESVVVRINDRGPFHGRRIIDLSKSAARQIGMLRQGTARVRIELLNRL